MNKLLIILFLAASAAAANGFVNLPVGDFVCQVEVSSHDKPEPENGNDHPGRVFSPSVVSIEITKTGNLRRDVFGLSDGTSRVVWSLVDQRVGFQVREENRDEVMVLIGLLYRQAIPAILHFSEESVAWIAEKSLVSRPSSDSGMLHFKQNMTLREGSRELAPEKAVYQAWVDLQTGILVKFDDGTSLYSLHFSKSPTSPLVLPPAVREKMEKLKEALAPHPRLK